MTQKLIFLDLETTGLDTDNCEIIEACYKDKSYYCDTYKPSCPIPFDVSGVTNIDNIDVLNRPPFKGSEIDFMLQNYAASDYIAVTHNTDFDLAVLDRHSIKFNRSICTYKLAWKLLPDLPNHKLGTLRAYFGIPHGDGVAHRADYDVEILEQVYISLVNLIPDVEGQTRGEFIDFLVKFSDQAKLEYQDIFHFGKYKGQKISDIAKSDFGYIMWLKNNTEDKKLKEYLLSL